MPLSRCYSGMTKFYYRYICLTPRSAAEIPTAKYSGVPLSCSYNQMLLLPAVDEAALTAEAVQPD